MENIRRFLLKEYLMKETKRAGFGGLDIQRTPMGTRVTLTIERPGLVIGRKGGSIKFLESSVEKDFSFDNPKIEVQEVRNPNLNAQIMAEKLASALERGWHFRRAGHSTVRRIMDAGAKGCQIVISGKLTGQRHRVEKFKEGHIKFCGEPAIQWMQEGFAVAKRKLGVIGVKVQIMDPEAKLPDEVEIKAVEEQKEEAPLEKGKDDETKAPSEIEVGKKTKIDKKKLEKKLKKEKQKHKLTEEELAELEAEDEDQKDIPEEKKEEAPFIKAKDDETKDAKEIEVEKKVKTDKKKQEKKLKKEKQKDKLIEEKLPEPEAEDKDHKGIPEEKKEEGENENKEEVKSNEPDKE
jgi:small subunit ribosomal protein S3